MKTEIILKSDSFSYPTKAERKEIKKRIPKISRLDIAYISAFIDFIENSEIENAITKEDIYWWNNCLNNRIGKLNETYIYTATHYQRLERSKLHEGNQKHTDKVLFEYYVEIFYYYFFSTRDVLGQLLNIMFDLRIDETKIHLNQNFIDKIKSENIRFELKKFLENTRDSYNIRNAFNHRFTPIHRDNRAKKIITKQEKSISFGTAEEIHIEDYISDIENLMKHLSILLNGVDKLNIE
ncbi:Cthe_2314 family HEPN domain-containing protein [Segetibacter koreensis]|uniref:Cthe_2314 family HEPN domain-containing protein n=1 Tax=Segetibacter koreensis TaxID=398037 RepID=UPI0003801128|nr:Cthe_2314 family HEPN domain-containing protein [Segetibacter koreensis]